MAGSTRLQASQEWFPQWRFCWEHPRHTENYAKCPSWQHWMERFWLSVFAKGQLNSISKDILSKGCWLSVYVRESIKTIANSKVSTIVHCAGPIKIEKASTSTAAVRCRTASWDEYILKSGGIMSQNPAKTQIRVFDGTLKRCWSFPPILPTKPHPKPTKGPKLWPSLCRLMINRSLRDPNDR